MAKEQLFHVGVKAVITNADDEVLILEVNVAHFTHNKTPHADLPGGRIQAGQDVETTLRRELDEETGITNLSSITFMTAVISNVMIPGDNGELVGLVLMVYKIHIPENTKITLSDEHIGYEWVDRTEAKMRLAHKYPPEFTDQI